MTTRPRSIRPYSIASKLSWQLAIQTAIVLSVLCIAIWNLTHYLLERKHLAQWNSYVALVQEDLREELRRGEAAVVDKMHRSAQRRRATWLVLGYANGTDFYRDASPSFAIDEPQTQRGRFAIAAPSWPGGVIRGVLVLDCTDDWVVLDRLAVALALTAMGGGLLAGMAAAWRVRRGLAPVLELAEQTRTLGAQALWRRLHLKHPVIELQPAIDQLNSLMDRLERSYAQLESFNADVAHELRTPLFFMIGHTELAVSRERPVSELVDTLAVNLEGLQRMAGIVNDMLFLAGADRGTRASRLTKAKLSDLVEQVAEYHDAALEESGLQVVIAGDACLSVDVPLIKRAMSNLIANATRYAQPGSRITVRISGDQPEPPHPVDPHQFAILVENQGPPISEVHLPRIFDRFFRADAARAATGGEPHSGLGLAIVAAIARMHHGRTFAASDEVSTRIGFTVAAT